MLFAVVFINRMQNYFVMNRQAEMCNAATNDKGNLAVPKKILHFVKVGCNQFMHKDVFIVSVSIKHLVVLVV